MLCTPEEADGTGHDEEEEERRARRGGPSPRSGSGARTARRRWSTQGAATPPPPPPDPPDLPIRPRPARDPVTGARRLEAVADHRPGRGARGETRSGYRGTGPPGARITRMTEHRVAAAVFRHEGRVLLCHRSRTRGWYPDCWDLPGGHSRAGESGEDAAGARVRRGAGRARPRRTTARGVARPAGAWTCTCSSWRPGTGRSSTRPPEEHDELGWFTADELSSLVLADRALPDRAAAAARRTVRSRRSDDVPQARVELATFRLGGGCSIH